jgi:hypothetical protein
MKNIPTSWRARMAVVGLLAGLASGGLSGCTSPRNTLGTNSSPCFKALPVGTEAVEHQGKLVGVRLLGTRQLVNRPRLDALLDARAPNQKTVCVVAFEDSFHPHQVKDLYGAPPASGTGKVAVVVVSFPQNHLVGTLLLARLPLPFRHEA